MSTEDLNKDNARTKQFSELDLQILRCMQTNGRISLEQLSSKLAVPKSTLYYRIGRLEEEGVIEGYYSKINPSKLGLDFKAVILIRAKFGPQFHKKVGEALAQLPGVSAIYFLFGEIDFFVIMRSRDRADFFSKMEKLYNMPEIERANSVIVAETIKEDPRIQI